ncbi:TIGR01777 family oxidoreductase [Pontimonas sp.]|nr:TIGR01777 family oxidoreductase [Pontimonas sp.]MDA8863116.1 TIGR01777 family oxidoreductase [Pontimonas sp.]
MLKGYREDAKRLRILLAGASGMIGTPLKALLREQGHAVHTLVRRTPADATEHQWNPDTGDIESGILNHSDVVVNLSGASIGRIPWTKGYKKTILQSRLLATDTLARAIRDATTPPSLLVQGSAVGFYGDRDGAELTERSDKGQGFLADVVEQWEAAAEPAQSSSTRICYARTGLVVGKGGAMAPLQLQTSLGVGGPIGSGSQWWPWISLHDEVRALAHLINHETTYGIFNLVAPNPATALDVTKELARKMGRPHWLGLPAFAISLVMGEAGRELLLTSQRITPERLLASGFSFDDATLDLAIVRLLHKG